LASASGACAGAGVATLAGASGHGQKYSGPNRITNVNRVAAARISPNQARGSSADPQETLRENPKPEGRNPQGQTEPEFRHNTSDRCAAYSHSFAAGVKIRFRYSDFCLRPSDFGRAYILNQPITKEPPAPKSRWLNFGRKLPLELNETCQELRRTC